MTCKNAGPVTLVRDFFSTPEKPVTKEELMAIGAAGIKELAELIRAQCPA